VARKEVKEVEEVNEVKDFVAAAFRGGRFFALCILPCSAGLLSQPLWGGVICGSCSVIRKGERTKRRGAEDAEAAQGRRRGIGRAGEYTPREFA